MKKLRLKLASNHITALWQSQNLNQDMLSTKPILLSTVLGIDVNKLIQSNTQEDLGTIYEFLLREVGEVGTCFWGKCPQERAHWELR